MIPASPVIPGLEEAEYKIAENQPEYNPLPALFRGHQGIVLTRWVMSEEERAIFLEKGEIFLQVLTFGNPLQPVSLSVESPAVYRMTFAEFAAANSLAVIDGGVIFVGESGAAKAFFDDARAAGYKVKIEVQGRPPDERSFRISLDEGKVTG